MKPTFQKSANAMTIPVSGMHCRSCEMLIEEKLKEVPGVSNASVEYKKGMAHLFYGSKKPNIGELEAAIREAGYSVGTVGKKPFLSRNASDYRNLGAAALAVLVSFLILRAFGWGSLSFVPDSSKGVSLFVIFLVGLTAGLSTCMALVGGLVLGISARYAEKHPESTAFQKFRPHLFFNLGRVVSYAVLGGALGAIGSVVAPSGTLLGVLTILIGVIMLFLGLKLVGIFPRLEALSLALPKGVARFVGGGRGHREYGHGNAMLLGATTFFLPCGFTQSMQLVAVGSGSFAGGAFVMGLFALGTAPGLLGIGGAASAVKGIFAERFFAFAGVVVLIFSALNISNGLNLIGWRIGSSSPNSFREPTAAGESKPLSPVSSESGVQVVRMTQDGYGYHPQTFTVEKNRPVKLIVTSTNPYSCASSLSIPGMDVQKNLKSGENVIEFTPTESGVIPFSCSMGMYSGTIVVR